MDYLIKGGKFLSTGLFLAIFTMGLSGEAGAYCSSRGSNSTYEWLQYVKFAGVVKYSGNNGGYADFTNHQIINLSGGANSVTLVPGFSSSSYTEYWKIWIDFNYDSVFSADESVFSGTSRSSISGSIFIPNTATSGTTRMRVSMKYASAPQPCETFYYGEVEDYTVNLDTTDITPPTVVSKSPAATAVDVDLNSVISVTFSENIDPLSISNSSISLSHAGIYVGGVVSLNGNVATFIPDQPLAYSTEYTVTVYSGLLDLAGNALAQDEVWSFTTVAPDIILPTITQVSPQDGANDVSNNFVVSALFSEAMDPATVNASAFVISDGVNNITGSIVLNGNGSTAQFYPDQPFDYSTTYTVTIAGSVTDIAGNPLGSDYVWSFTSREFQLEYCLSYATNYSYMWIAAVKVGSFTHHSSAQPNSGYSDNTDTIFDLSRYFPASVTLTPGYSSFTYITYWRVFIDWNKDGVFTADETALSGSGDMAVSGSITVPNHAVAGNTRMRVSMQYSTYPGSCGSLSYGEVEDYRVSVPEALPDYTPPTVTTVSPPDNALNVPVNSLVTVDFSEAIDESTLSNTSLTLTGGTVPVNSTVSYNPETKQAVFSPTANLQYNTSYIATLSNSISDAAGNTMLENYSWSFTTAVETAPMHTVSGAILEQGTGLTGVTINVSGDASLSTTTDTNGNYSLTLLPAGNYTLTPEKGGYTFAPESIGVTVVDANISAVDFVANALPSVLVNGDFQQGSFNGFTFFTTADGVADSGIYFEDVNNDGVGSMAAVFSVGTDNMNAIGTPQGGGIYQIVGLSEGELSLSMDIAAKASWGNGDGGLVEVLLDGVVMDSHDFGDLSDSIFEYASLTFTVANVSAGNHEIRIRITRQYMVTSVSNYVDDIVLTGSSTY